VGALKKLLQQAELVHDLQGGGVDGVTAEVPEEIGVFFQHHQIYSGASQQKAQHDTGRPTAHDAAASLDALV
jgi:hypothetical protein